MLFRCLFNLDVFGATDDECVAEFSATITLVSVPRSLTDLLISMGATVLSSTKLRGHMVFQSTPLRGRHGSKYTYDTRCSEGHLRPQGK